MKFLKDYEPNKGSMSLTVALVLMLVIIGILIYLLSAKSYKQSNKAANFLAGQEAYIQKAKKTSAGFSDGLENPNSVSKYSLDEFGDGIASIEVFDRDINNDGKTDRISRIRHENGTSHFYYEYKIEINQNGQFVNITPEDFTTSEGADCSLQKIQFSFEPKFRVIKISRDWDQSWDTPTLARQTTFSLVKNSMHNLGTKDLKVVCDVKDLFN